MKKLGWILAILLFSAAGLSKDNPEKEKSQLNKDEKVIHKNYLSFCQKRVQKEKYSLKKAKTICQCSLENIQKNSSLEAVKTLSKESPKMLKFKTEEDKKLSSHLRALSTLEVHSLDKCSKAATKK